MLPYSYGDQTFISLVCDIVMFEVIGRRRESPTTYFQSIARGVIDTRDIVFFFCFCGFFLYLNVMALQGRRLAG